MSKPIVTPEKIAVERGYWSVSLPTWLLLMGSIWPPILYLGFDKAFNTPSGLWTIGVGFLGGTLAGWAWWSVTAPRWRLWAYRRVTNLNLLEEIAVTDNLVWPVNHFMTRTELRSGQLRKQLETYEASMRRVS